MANSHKTLVTQIQADEKVLNANRRAMEKVKLQYQCKCTHRDANGSFALSVPQSNGPKSDYTGAPLYRCRICKKELDISNIPEEEFYRSFNAINRVLDIAKMNLDLRSEKDEDLLKTIMKLQYKMNSIIPDLYRTIRKGGRRKKKNNNAMSSFIEVSR